MLKDRAQCERSLQKAITGGFFNYPLLVSDPFFDSVRDDPAIRQSIREAKEKQDSFIRKFNLNPDSP